MIHQKLALQIAKEADKLRFSMGWGYENISKHLMEKYDLDLADFDEIIREAEEKED